MITDGSCLIELSTDLLPDITDIGVDLSVVFIALSMLAMALPDKNFDDTKEMFLVTGVLFVDDLALVEEEDAAFEANVFLSSMVLILSLLYLLKTVFEKELAVISMCYRIC